MKLNLGCGFDKRQGYINVDVFPECSPDLLFDLEVCPWPWEDSTVDEVMFNHSLEHIGGDPRVFLSIMKELYRVCCHGCVIQINVPHPRHDNFIGDPTHVRIITPQLLRLFSRQLNEEVQKLGGANTPFALYLNVDFEITNLNQVLDEPYASHFRDGKLSIEELVVAISEKNNVVSEYQITLRALK